MNPAQEDEIDALLHAQFNGPVADEGFSDRVMHELPNRRRRTGWTLWAGLLAGMAASWLALLPSPLLRTGWHDAVQGSWSVPLVGVLSVLGAMAVLALAWAVAEADHC